MIRKTFLVAVLGLALLVTGVSTGAHRKVAASAQSFQRYFQDLKGAGKSVSPVEHFVFSLVLAGADTHRAEK
jgi:hypothetical protein